MTRAECFAQALALQAAGRLHDARDAAMEDVFRGSVDRFVEIAHRLQGCRRVLDVGSGHGQLLALLHALGHDCHGVDHEDMRARYPVAYDLAAAHGGPIDFRVCNVESDRLPYPDASFDAVTCCQVLEHFSHSHLPALREIHRVLASGGLVEIDVPNVASLRNRVRLLRGRNITYDYAEHYLHAEPILHAGRSYFPLRHNREFTRDELALLLAEAGFRDIEVRFLRSRRWRSGWSRLRSLGTALRDSVPSLRKSLIAFAVK